MRPRWPPRPAWPPSSPHPHHRITIDAAGPLLVWVDPLAITRILGNLLDNAAAHGPPGSLIRLIGGRDGTQAVLAVQDQGPGIPADARERIFERYARGARHAGPAAGGLGLGLYIARRLAHANHGQLYVTDHPARHGARLELRLPLAEAIGRVRSGLSTAAALGHQQADVSAREGTA